jgi:hypothetical protein
MSDSVYTYSIQNDFPNHVVATDRLTQEIQQSSIVTALDYINTNADACNIYFKAALSGTDQTTLNGIVAAHSGVPLAVSASASIGPVPVVVNGYVTTTSTGYTAIRATTYAEQTVNGQRSLQSLSANDAAAGTGARQVRITYYDQTLAGPFYETVTLNGTTPVNTVGTNICFVDSMFVISVGTDLANDGNIYLKAGTGGTGAVIGEIVAGDNQTYWCHHYVASSAATRIVEVTGTLKGSYGGRLDIRSHDPTNTNSPEHTITTPIRLLPGDTQDIGFNAPVEIVGPAIIIFYARPDNVASADWNVGFGYYEVSS